MSFQIETLLKERPKGRTPIWVVRLRDGDAIAFTSETRSLHLRDEAAARLLGRALATCLASGVSMRSDVDWQGDLSDDCTARIGRFQAHAEHLQGPRRGGVWYCQVFDVLHSEEAGIVPRSGRAARWLCEVIAVAAELGFAALPDEPRRTQSN